MRKFTVNIVGKDFTILGRDDEERVKDVAKIVEKEYLNIDKAYPTLSISDKAFLTAMTITDNSMDNNGANIVNDLQDKVNKLVNDIIDLKEELNEANSIIAKKQDSNDELKIELEEKKHLIDELKIYIEKKEQEIDKIASESLDKQRELSKIKEYVTELHLELEKANVKFVDEDEFEVEYASKQDESNDDNEEDIKLYSNE